jgi:Fe-S-cluster-containing dehydrogenase component
MSFQENCIGCAARVDACPYETKIAEEKLDLSRAEQKGRINSWRPCKKLSDTSKIYELCVQPLYTHNQDITYKRGN